MTWTQELPTEHGWYWHRDRDGPEVAHVGRAGVVFLNGRSSLLYAIEDMGGEWYGPLPVPGEKP